MLVAPLGSHFLLPLVVRATTTGKFRHMLSADQGAMRSFCVGETPYW